MELGACILAVHNELITVDVWKVPDRNFIFVPHDDAFPAADTLPNAVHVKRINDDAFYEEQKSHRACNVERDTNGINAGC
jgi:hypothetical protein